jgi:hypothetical protein
MSAVLRIDRNDHLTGALAELEREFIAAFRESPEATVRTPAYSKARSTIAEAVADGFSSFEDGKCVGDTYLHNLLRIVANAAAGRNVKAAAMLWIAEQACEFARTHADDLAREMEDDAAAAGRRFA